MGNQSGKSDVGKPTTIPQFFWLETQLESALTLFFPPSFAVQTFLSEAKADFQRKWDNPEQVGKIYST